MAESAAPEFRLTEEQFEKAKEVLERRYRGWSEEGLQQMAQLYLGEIERRKSEAAGGS